RDTRHEVAAFDLHRLNFIARVSRTDSNFDQLRRSLAHEQIVFSFYELGDGLIHLVTTHSDGAGKNDPGYGDHRNLGCSAADIDNHIAGGLSDRQPGSYGCCHRFFDEIDFPRSCGLCGFSYRALLYFGNPEWNTHNDTRPNQCAAIVNFLDEVAKHRFGDFKV